MKIINKRLIACAVTVALTVPMTAMATNGYFSHGYGTKNKGLAGGGVALPQDAMAAATNPAGMVTVGDRMDLGVALFSPSPRSYTDDNPAVGFVSGPAGLGQESDNDFFLIPHFARNWMLDSDSSVGVTVYGNGGMNTEYPTGVYAGGVAGVTGINLEQLFINASYSRKIDATSSWGASLIAVYQTFEAKGFGVFAPFSTSVGNLTNNGKDSATGFGAKFGWQGEVAKDVTLAASYQTKMSMGEFSKYSGLFAEGGGFDVPSTWTLGLAWNTSPKSTLTFDIQQINYTDVAAISNPLAPLATSCTPGTAATGGTGAGCLGGSNGAGFGYEDMTVYKLGYQWDTSADWTWRVGISQGDQPIPNGEVLFNIVAPAVMETHITGGFTMKTGSDSEFSLAAMYAPKTTVSGTVDTTSIGGGVDNISIEMTQFEVEASWAWKF